ncbi:MAG: LysE family translocator [Vibrio sp.]
MTLSVWFSLFSVCLLGAMSPGPSLAMVAKHSLAGGRIQGLVAAWSHAFGIGLYALATILGLSVVIQTLPTLFDVISIAGALYLAWLGYQSLSSKGGIAAKLKAGQKTSIIQSAREAFLISILSPKIMIFFTALFSQFIALSHDSSSRTIMVITPFLTDALWYTCVCLLLSKASWLEVLKAKAVWIDKLTGVLLIALALRVLYQHLS